MRQFLFFPPLFSLARDIEQFFFLCALSAEGAPKGRRSNHFPFFPRPVFVPCTLSSFGGTFFPRLSAAATVQRATGCRFHPCYTPFSLLFSPLPPVRSGGRRSTIRMLNSSVFRPPLSIPRYHSTHTGGGGGEREGQFHRLTVTAALASRFPFWNTGGRFGREQEGGEGRGGHCGKGRKEEGEMVKGERERGKRSLLRKVSEKRRVEGGKDGLAWSGAA